MTGACKKCLIFFKDVEAGTLNCSVKWKISENVKLGIVWHEQKLDYRKRDIRRQEAVERR